MPTPRAPLKGVHAPASQPAAFPITSGRPCAGAADNAAGTAAASVEPASVASIAGVGATAAGSAAAVAVLHFC